MEGRRSRKKKEHYIMRRDEPCLSFKHTGVFIIRHRHLPTSSQAAIRNLPVFAAEGFPPCFAFLLNASLIPGKVLVFGGQQGENDHERHQAIENKKKYPLADGQFFGFHGTMARNGLNKLSDRT